MILSILSNCIQRSSWSGSEITMLPSLMPTSSSEVQCAVDMTFLIPFSTSFRWRPALVQKVSQDVEETLVNVSVTFTSSSWWVFIFSVLLTSVCFWALLHCSLQLHLGAIPKITFIHSASFLSSSEIASRKVHRRKRLTWRGSPALAPSRVGENHGLKIFSQITWWTEGGEEGEEMIGNEKKWFIG